MDITLSEGPAMDRATRTHNTGWQRHRKRLLAVRAMAGETAWLAGRPRWQGDRVVWLTDNQRIVAATPNDLALAQRRLLQIAAHRRAAQRNFGDVDAWLAQRQNCLELAKVLRPLRASELPTQAAALVALLTAEAVCIGGLPWSPAAALLGHGAAAMVALQAIASDAALPIAVRGLAALVLGALPNNAPPNEPMLALYVQWGQQHGVPAYPALIVALLSSEHGYDLACRTHTALATAQHLRLAASQLHELLHTYSANEVVASAEAMAAAAPLAERLRNYRALLPIAQPDAQKIVVKTERYYRQTAAKQLASQRQQLIDELNQIYAAYALAGPTAVTRFTTLITTLINRAPELLIASEPLIATLKVGPDLPTHQRADWLAFALEHAESLWPNDKIPQGHSMKMLADWFYKVRKEQLLPLGQLLSIGITRSQLQIAMQLRVTKIVVAYTWRDPAVCQYLFDLLERLPQVVHHTVNWLCRLLQSYTALANARGDLHPLLHPLYALPTNSAWLGASLLDECARLDLSRDQVLRLGRYMGRVIGFMTCYHGEWSLNEILISAVLAFDEYAPQQAEAWLDWLQACLLQPEHQISDWRDLRAWRLAVPLAAVLANSNNERFQELALVISRHQLTLDNLQIKAILPLLKRFSGLQAALAELLSTQPHRCLRLLIRLAYTHHLGTEVLTPLADLEVPYDASHKEYAFPADWQPMLDIAPELTPQAAAYRYAQWLLGNDLQPPPGIVKILDQPHKLLRELEHLEQRLNNADLHPGMAQRANNLRARLANPDGLLLRTRAELHERMRNVTAEAQLAAAEQQVLACYHRRLTMLVGKLPADIHVDDDLLNATLLSASVTSNRRLLYQLLRAHISGDHAWREQHPANAAFLKDLGERGVHVAIWLSAMPRVYRCPGVVGERIRLHLEQNPLRILQMGNYFDTCLSTRGINAFSTIANACELNKRVVYATDGSGNVIARKLIAISKAGGLLGYHTYCSVEQPAVAQHIRSITTRYLRQFAQTCGLALADTGAPAQLLAPHWYDDGEVAWSDTDEQNGTERLKKQPILQELRAKHVVKSATKNSYLG
jgi:hypothetical protein